MDAVIDRPRPATEGLAAFSLKEAPALIERVFPAQKVGVEAQKERKAGAGQTLTTLGSYWKGRKPLVLVRACVLASLLPATDDPDGDLEVFEALMAIDEQGLLRRQPSVDAGVVWASPAISQTEKDAHVEVGASAATGDDAEGSGDCTKRGPRARWRRLYVEPASDPASRRRARARLQAEREALIARAFSALPFAAKVAICERVERVEDIQNPADPLYEGVWERVNARLGTTARTIPELVEQLGVARFGHRPVIGDTFAGGGSIPFEAARVGCDVVASDLNPVAAMLTWGALNILRADVGSHVRIAEEQRRAAEAVDAEITRLGIEHNARGDRAKSYLYCLEVVDPQTGWLVPMAPSWVISRNHRCAARLVPDYDRKRFAIDVETGASAARMRDADKGTIQDGHLVYELALEFGGTKQEWRIPVSRLRGDGEGVGGARANKLRLWKLGDVSPRPHVWQPDERPEVPEAAAGAWVGGDIWQERLYCIQWLDGADLSAGRPRPSTRFAAPSEADLAVEAEILKLVSYSLPDLQSTGLVPDMALEHGHEVEGLIRTMGWTRWHHLFTPRALLMMSQVLRHNSPSVALVFAAYLDYASRIGRWDAGHPGSSPQVKNAFASQALRTNFSYACKSSYDLRGFWLSDLPRAPVSRPVSAKVRTGEASRFSSAIDIAVFDPPYADAVHYHEITEFFIAWLRKNPPPPFNDWTWDSRRPLAIQGKGEKFRADMVAALRAMAGRMPDNGLQVCMFTHKDAGVWADMAQIVWGAGLQVTAAWYVSTETTSELKRGGYVQGTVLLVLRKRRGDERAYRDEIVPAIRARVEEQVRALMGLNQRARGRMRDETPFSRADIQMAGYAAAMEVLTGVTHIDGTDMTREALRPRVKGERGLVEEMIGLAVQTATEFLIPEGIGEGLWERLAPAERFYLTMAETEADRTEANPGGKLDDYHNFAKAHRAEGWEDLMADNTPNRARLKGAAEFRRALMSGHPFADGVVRPTLYAVNELRFAAEREEDPKAAADRVLHGLRDHFGEWLRQRGAVREIAAWLGRAWERNRPAEASAARTLAGIVQTERL